MKQRTGNSIVAFLAGVMAMVMIIMFIDEAGATNRNDDVDIDVRNTDTTSQTQGQEQGQDQTATGGQASASNDGVTVGGDTSNVENNSSNIVLVPNNNTENCLRVFGFGFGKDGTSGGFGIPWRSKACDYEQAADDAFAAGERELGWFWKCQNKSLYKVFKLEGMSDDEAKNHCHQKAVGVIDAYATIDQLKRTIDFITSEREIEREKCSESKDRIVAGCYDGK